MDLVPLCTRICGEKMSGKMTEVPVMGFEWRRVHVQPTMPEYDRVVRCSTGSDMGFLGEVG